MIPANFVEQLRNELMAERDRREATERDLAGVRETLAEVRIALGKAEVLAEARVQALAAVERDRDRLAAEVADLRRPWLARLLDALRQR